MDTPTPEIRHALYRHLLCALPIGNVTQKDVAWPNVPFSPQQNRMYLRPFCLFNETTVAALSKNGFERLTGIFQVTVCGILNIGEAVIEDTARVLIDHFRGGTCLQMEKYQPLRIQNAFRSTLQINTMGGTDSSVRPEIIVSASWVHYVPKGD